MSAIFVGGARAAQGVYKVFADTGFASSHCSNKNPAIGSLQPVKLCRREERQEKGGAL